MNLKAIFKIPIYSMSEKDFVNRWEKSKKRKYYQYIRSGLAKEDALRMVNDMSCPSWHDRQQVGYIQISVNSREVYFDVFCSSAKTYRFDQNNSVYKKYQVNGNHIFVENKSNRYIKKAILVTLESLENQLPKLYVDYSIFNNLFKYINIKRIMEDLVN